VSKGRIRYDNSGLYIVLMARILMQNNHEACAVMPMCTVDKYIPHWVCSTGEKL
jgi:hypothetical protein